LTWRLIMDTKIENLLDAPQNVDRRKFLNTAAAAGVASTFLSMGLIGCKQQAAPNAAGSASVAAAGHSADVAPGQLDSYYGLWSGGHTGDVRVLGLPSGREIHRIPVFNPDALVGWGITNESKAVMGTKPDGSLK
jgi:nitrous-oxide reductase